MSDAEKTVPSNKGSAWPFPTSGTAPETAKPDLSSIDFRIYELPVEMQLEFERRSNAGFAVIEGVRGNTQEINELHNQRSPLGLGDGIKAAVVILLLGVLGHYFSTFFYFLALLAVALVALLYAEHLSNAENKDAALRVCKARLEELKYRWLLSGFRLTEFAELNATIHRYADDPMDNPEFREWWCRVTMLVNCSLRRHSNLPDHPDLPMSWELYQYGED